MKSNTLNLVNNINNYQKEIIKPSKKLNEADNINNEIKLYMNTWKNYNENGADLEEMYGIEDGWMTIEQAKEFAEKYNEDEPFINDTDNAPWSIDEYDSINDVIEYLERYESVDNKEALTAIIEEQGESNLESAFEIYESGEFLFFQGVEDDADLAKAYIDMCGGLDAAIPQNEMDRYIDEEAYRDSWQEFAEDAVREENPELEETDPDKFEEEVNKLQTNFAEEQLEIDIMDGADLSNYFDYDAFGSNLQMDGGYFYASTGAICTL